MALPSCPTQVAVQSRSASMLSLGCTVLLGAGAEPGFRVRVLGEGPSGEDAEQQGKQCEAGNSDQSQQGGGGGQGALRGLAATLKEIGKSNPVLDKASSAGWRLRYKSTCAHQEPSPSIRAWQRIRLGWIEQLP